MIIDNDLLLAEANMTDTTNELRVMNEAYFGKNDNLVAIEKNFQSIIDKYVKGVGKDANIDRTSIILSKEMKNIKALTSKEFGFNKVGVDMMVLGSPVMGIPMGTFGQSKPIPPKVLSTGKGFMFNPKDKVNISITFDPSLLSCGVNGEEMTAIYLHEIGHNFTPSVSKRMRFCFPILSVMQVFGMMIKYFADLLVLSAKTDRSRGETITRAAINGVAGLGIASYIKKHIIDIENALESGLENMEKNFPAMFNSFKGFYNGMNHIATTAAKGIRTGTDIIDAFKSLSGPIIDTAKIPLRYLSYLLIKPFGYLDERFADNFPVMYGYGPALERGLSKLSMGKDNIFGFNIPILSQFADLVTCIPRMILGEMVNEHPNIAARYNLVEKSLKREISKCKDPDMRDILNDQLNECRKIAEETFTADTTIRGFIDPDLYSRILYGAMCKTFGGDLRQYYRGTDIYSDIDDMVNKVK